MLKTRPRVKRFRQIAATAGALLLLVGCSPADVEPPEEARREKSRAEGFVETFFEYLDEGEGAALDLTTISRESEQERYVLFHADIGRESDPYEDVTDRPELLEATARWARLPLVLVDVTYKMGEHEVEDSILVRHRDRIDGEKAGTGGHSRIELSPSSFGINVDGVQFLPENTRYSISGIDITEAIHEVASDSSIPPDEKFQLPALGGTYVVDVEVPGDDGFSESVTVETLAFYGINRNEEIFLELAEKHGFTEELWH